MRMYNCKGNALLYVLIGIALLASLTYAISKDGGGQQQNQLTAAQVKLLATDLIKHATEAEMAVQQMTQWGIEYDEILFDLPGTAGYSTNVSRQLYHPSGGGVSLLPPPRRDPSAAPPQESTAPHEGTPSTLGPLRRTTLEKRRLLTTGRTQPPQSTSSPQGPTPWPTLFLRVLDR